MRKTLFLLVALVAAPALVLSKMENAVVPEASMESKDSTSHEDATFLLNSAGSKPIDAAKLVVEKMKANPESLTSLNQAIETIIGEITAKTTVDQQLVDGEIAAFVTASALPVRDTALDTAQTTTCALVVPAQRALTATQTKSYQLDFGATADTAQLAANSAKGNVDTDLLAFEQGLRDLNAKTLACSGATTAATAAAGDLATAKDRAYCQAKDSYDLVVTDVTTNSATQITNIKHFKMLKCVMTQYAADTKEKAALDKCSAQTYDVDVESVTVDLKASQAVVPASTVCVPVTNTGGASSYTYFRYRVPESSKNGQNGFVCIGNFALFDSAGSQLALDAVVCGSAPCAAGSSTATSANWLISNAFDSDTSPKGSAWCSAVGWGWLEYRFGAPTTVSRVEIVFWNKSHSARGDAYLEGSNDGSTWTTLHTTTQTHYSTLGVDMVTGQEDVAF